MIWLREMKHEDKSQFVQFLNDERVIKFLSSRIPFPYTETDAECVLLGVAKMMELSALSSVTDTL
jgi:hypothetical protein